MKRLYLDVCTYCRPFDNQNALRIRLETDAVHLIMQHIKVGKYQTIISPAHFAEINAINLPDKKLELETVLKQLETPISYDSAKISQRVRQLSALKFGVADATHVAFAEELADVFLTCDDKLLKKCKKNSLSILTMNPLELLTTEDLK